MKTIQKKPLETGIEMPGWARDLGGIMQSSAPSSDEWAYTSYAVDSKILLILLREYNFDIDNVRVVLNFSKHLSQWIHCMALLMIFNHTIYS